MGSFAGAFCLWCDSPVVMMQVVNVVNAHENVLFNCTQIAQDFLS